MEEYVDERERKKSALITCNDHHAMTRFEIMTPNTSVYGTSELSELFIIIKQPLLISLVKT